MFHTYGEIAAAHPTGKTRVRVGWFGRLILQVQIKHPNPNYPKPPRPGPYDPWANGAYYFWRDATLADLQCVGFEGHPRAVA
ncbi:hypothetical protein [Pseudorhodoplanes sinuspersici]|uniref:Uncharacterized protein n=1 Tax=Pseudorhodoplanes sinuspersici TaxID=1235591 RepID=A0A1W6ZX77_9HYPH|nr:hypothetical protein [Pseudorhodoplanes sinuspersici]ARQ01920.1 hypothetical protein CAK95_24580 [Pseudorhodoplanes sinuspersici]RKE73691.1 hypothetical protein DFP91_1586 [Pseudorhodoplanes sinuspersici]